jgi:hypothetical protein
MRPEQFTPLQSRFKLPSFEELDRHYDIGSIDDDCKRLVLDIAQKVHDRFDYVLKILEEVLQPETSVATMQESAAFSEEERAEMFLLYRKLMYLFREAQALELEADEQKLGTFISSAHKEYISMLPQLISTIKHLQRVWKTEQSGSSELGYFG